MSDTPPDRKEADDARAAPKNAWMAFLVIVLLLPVLYVLSTGPVIKLIEKHYLPEAAALIYQPLNQLPKPLLRPIVLYVEWWCV